MAWQAYFCLGVIAAVFGGLVTNVATDAVLIAALILVTLVGIVTPEEALSGFSNAGMLTVGALFVVAAGLRETGALDRLGSFVLGRAKSERGVLVRLSGSVTLMSAFLNNTPIVAMFIPIVTDWCRKHAVAPSRLLLPLSYLCILGGTCTLIGTSTNLVVNGLMAETAEIEPELASQLRPMGFFELGYVGVPYALVGIAYLLVVGQRRLPARKELLEQLSDSAREYLVNLQIEPSCRLAGQDIEMAGLRKLPGLFLIEIRRGEETVSPVPPDQILRAHDVLTFTGAVDTIVDLRRTPGLVPAGEDDRETGGERSKGRALCEAVVSASCPVIGKTIRDADFRARYNAAVVAVHRNGVRLRGKVGDVLLRQGDTLLLQAGPHFARANRNNPDFLLVSGLDGARPVRSEHAIVSLVLLGLLVLMMATGIVSIVVAAFLVAALMVVLRCISVADARRSIDWQTLITIAAAFGLGKALENSGAADAIAEQVVGAAGCLGPVAVLGGVYLMTSMFTEVITNNAAAALTFPFAVAIAGQLGADARPFCMAVTFAASASFITPLGYQTNLMVYGPGGYRLGDFVRVGLPLNLILLTTATLLIPLVWPL